MRCSPARSGSLTRQGFLRGAARMGGAALVAGCGQFRQQFENGCANDLCHAPRGHLAVRRGRRKADKISWTRCAQRL